MYSPYCMAFNNDAMLYCRNTMNHKYLEPGDKVKPKNYHPPKDGYTNSVPVGWRLISFSQEGKAIVQVVLISYCCYEVEDLEFGGNG